ncbi:glycosyltransferase, partial [Alphaproteobacteria bacterium]|nr:glycosyltransferase [Alphaproteobacteria bacterium]
RPRTVYVSTDPPVVVPFFVMIYSQLFGAEYIYHLQDIHPEATNVVIPVNKWIYKLVLKMDVLSIRNAKRLITITDQMVTEIRQRSQTKASINVLANPAVSFDGIDTSKPKTLGFSFCGNAGRMQRIPLILSAIETYFKRGGRLDFIFAGGGVYSNHLKDFSKNFSHFHYRGLVSSSEAAQISADYTWALLPIDDEITRFAFPSKASSYVCSGANILAVCSEYTSVAQWINANQVGLVVKPDVESIVDIFFKIEKAAFKDLIGEESRDSLKANLRFEVFIKALNKLVLT